MPENKNPGNNTGPGPAPEELQSRLDFALRITREAGTLVRRGFRHRVNTIHKGEIDLVTEYDLASEEHIIQAIKQTFPEDGISAEESGTNSSGHFQWFVDPIDGTTNFARGIVPWSVTVACSIGWDIQAGVIYDPMQEEMFHAVRGGGAWLNDTKLSVSSLTDLDQAFFATGFPYDIRTHKQKNLRHFNAMAVSTLGIRRLGTASLDLAYVAAGRFDGYWEHRLHPWDWAAGALLIQEAGGQVSRIDGGNDIFSPPTSLLATNGPIHDQALAVLNSV